MMQRSLLICCQGPASVLHASTKYSNEDHNMREIPLWGEATPGWKTCCDSASKDSARSPTSGSTTPRYDRNTSPHSTPRAALQSAAVDACAHAMVPCVNHGGCQHAQHPPCSTRELRGTTNACVANGWSATCVTSGRTRYDTPHLAFFVRPGQIVQVGNTLWRGSTPSHRSSRRRRSVYRRRVEVTGRFQT